MADQMKFRVSPEQVDAARAKLAEAGFPFFRRVRSGCQGFLSRPDDHFRRGVDADGRSELRGA